MPDTMFAASKPGGIVNWRWIARFTYFTGHPGCCCTCSASMYMTLLLTRIEISLGSKCFASMSTSKLSGAPCNGEFGIIALYGETVDMVTITFFFCYETFFAITKFTRFSKSVCVCASLVTTCFSFHRRCLTGERINADRYLYLTKFMRTRARCFDVEKSLCECDANTYVSKKIRQIHCTSLTLEALNTLALHRYFNNKIILCHRLNSICVCRFWWFPFV